MKILYVENNPQNIRLVRKMLHIAGYEVLEAMDGITGVQVATQETPNLILMDINLPDIDGMEVASRIRSNPLLQNVPIIALTAKAMYADKERFLNAGYDSFLAKPISRTELLNTIQYFLGAISH